MEKKKTWLRPWMVGVSALLILAGIAWAVKPFRVSGGIQTAPQASWQGSSGVPGIYYKTGTGCMCRNPDNTETNMSGGGGGGGYSTIEEEGSGLTQRSTLNFAGNGATCADDTTKTTCTIPGLTVQDEGTPVTFRATINFAGAGVSCVDDTTRTTCTISGGGGGSTLAASYAAGAAAADQTLLVQSGDGGPVIFKANGAATGPLVQAQTSTGTVLMSVPDNDTISFTSQEADGATAVGFDLLCENAITTSGGACFRVRDSSGVNLFLTRDTGSVAEWQSSRATVGLRSTNALVAASNSGGAQLSYASNSVVVGSGTVGITTTTATVTATDLNVAATINNKISGNETTTVGAAGGASALPATPLGYLTIKLNAGTSVKVPYYNP